MKEETRSALAQHLHLLCCPSCRSDLELAVDRLACSRCERSFGFSGEIPLLYWPSDPAESRGDVTEVVKAFYEETPFPSYDEFDSVASLIEKARRGIFAARLDEEVPPGSTILEVGCGTGQLTNFLSVANRTVFGADICLNSLALAQQFKEQNHLARSHFVQMNLFRPIFRQESFDLVIANGVLHHTADPQAAFRSIAGLVKPNGHVLVGLYHRYGRLLTDLRRLVFRLSGNRFTFLDPNLRAGGFDGAKRLAWFRDQYKNPHESKHGIGEVMGWLEEAGLGFVQSLPRSRPFQRFSPAESLFEPEQPGSRLERLVVELGMIRSGSREGGFFVVIGRRPAS